MQLTDAPSAQDRAEGVIRQFRGLRVGAVGPGRELAASDVHFYSSARPEVASVVRAWSHQLGELAAVATAHHDHIILFVNSTGGFYAFTDPDERLYSIGQSFGEAMERLLLGLRYGASIPQDA
jgi:SUKH-3 immunity protein